MTFRTQENQKTGQRLAAAKILFPQRCNLGMIAVNLKVIWEMSVYDTSLPGNSNRGHQGATDGTELEPHEKDAIVQYMKTL